MALMETNMAVKRGNRSKKKLSNRSKSKRAVLKRRRRQRKISQRKGMRAR
ncbi:hypothetical protein AKJ08_3619 [Vulgatibacter incomptus]|uniref:Uncharacterized protein n=1 Tax=Vulgatibacter incomptus TaxID=1391653 RepID=A0A0K1PIA3_9BACT|nr:hypothetical protein AKJ08_3619 [Vulgatibacter incomptus]